MEVGGLLEKRESELMERGDAIERVSRETRELVAWLEATEERLEEIADLKVEENLPVVEQLFQDFEVLPLVTKHRLIN